MRHLFVSGISTCLCCCVGDPLGQVVPSDGFKDKSFYLDLSLDTAEPGDYCCRLDCPAPTYCCLEERSPLRQCAYVHVMMQKAGATVKITDFVSTASFSQLQQQVQNVATDLKQLRLGLCTTKKGYAWYAGRCLKFDARSVDFQSAKAGCLADKGHLLYLKSADIAPLLQSAVAVAGKTVPSTAPGAFLHAWVGATATETERTFVWGDETVLPKSSPLWSIGEPNDNGGSEDCVEIYLDSTSFYLNDDLCSHEHGYFCEYD